MFAIYADESSTEFKKGRKHGTGDLLEREVLQITFSFSSSSEPQRPEVMARASELVQRLKIDWLVPRPSGTWTFRLSSLFDYLPRIGFSEQEMRAVDWLKSGRVEVEPEFSVGSMPDHPVARKFIRPSSYLKFYLQPVSEVELEAMPGPAESDGISESLGEFRRLYPDPMSVAFLMMKFGRTAAHDRLVAAIRKAFAKHGITVLRADDRQFHDELLPNIKTYMHGCGIGIAVFERIQSDDFNPNASLEVGYMLALQKPVCLLKDETLKALNTDLVGRLYKSFDVHNPEGAIPDEVDKWLQHKRLIEMP